MSYKNQDLLSHFYYAEKWYQVFHTKYSLNTFAPIDMCLLKVIYWRALMHQHRQKQGKTPQALTHHAVLYSFFSYDIKKYSATTISH